MSDGGHASDGARRTELVALAEQLRPELHRYCARLMGSVIDGEDVVQDALTKALVAADEMRDVTTLRAWLFRVAHNRALDLLRSRAIRTVEPMETANHVADDATPDALEMMMRQDAIRTAVSRFTELSIVQRSVLILKDVLDEPLADIAALLNLSVDSVKAHLARGRARLAAINAVADAQAPSRPASDAVARYVALFNRRDWDGLRALLAYDVRLHQSTHPVRVGSVDVGMFFGIYAKFDGVWLTPAWLEGREVVAVFENRGDARPSYVMWLTWRDGKISFIRDYRYVRYVIADAELVLAADAPDRS
ncbi:putative RNA polymerase sigma subunit [Bradyrhizobium oligotrophicum S58]|uniref:Putative RNA polymerase sigma subunit n=1 Tax=Bradyrhizobium oligotrophicum S58 TaxID=1245469 RepID=M4ZAF3_9BRAD|nr:sigma-70 family RNA polymerase sigma factor [Bradyrhizobium oligotrophicum]BAM90311.1 putative RNA polymerase sigma subunit [Bradyrhizobium oligotrophicum S58]